MMDDINKILEQKFQSRMECFLKHGTKDRIIYQIPKDLDLICDPNIRQIIYDSSYSKIELELRQFTDGINVWFQFVLI